MAQDYTEEPMLHQCTCQTGRGISGLPAEGEKVRVTLLKDVQSWKGKDRITIPKDTVYEGVAMAIESEGFFDVVKGDDERMKFYIHDSSIKVESLTPAS